MKKILIIDDDARNVYALSAVLRSRGFQYITAADGKEGMTLLAADGHIGLVLMDMMMPEMDGYTMVAQMKADSRLSHIPVIAVTAQAMPGDREKCLAAGSDDYLSKPIDMDKLLAMLQQYTLNSAK